jgi:hypothetical protein
MFNTQCAKMVAYCVLAIAHWIQGCQGIIGHGPSAFLDKLLEKNWDKGKKSLLNTVTFRRMWVMAEHNNP